MTEEDVTVIKTYESENKELEFEPAKFRSDMTVRLVDHMGDEQSIVRRARVSTAGSLSQENVPGTELSKRDKGLIKRLYADRHGVPFEGVEFEFYFEIPVFVDRQIVKHRLTSINGSSGRYRELEGEFYVIPPSSSERMITQVGKTMEYNFEPAPPEVQDVTRQVQMATAEGAWHNYNGLLEVGVAKEVARMHLPFTLYTQMYYKSNLRSLLNFVSLRKQWEGAEHPSHAQYEIALVADQIADIIKELLPNVWDAFVESGYQAV